MQGIPYRSKLLPHFERIRSERLMRKTWREISELLEHAHGIKASPSNVYEFFKRKLQNTANPLGFPTEATSGLAFEENPTKSSTLTKENGKQKVEQQQKLRKNRKAAEELVSQKTEEDRKLREAARLAEEKARQKTEEDRKLQEVARLAEEKARQKTDEDRKLQEVARLAEEKARLKTEEDRKLQEAARQAEEKANQIMEQHRKILEAAKLAEDKARIIIEPRVEDQASQIHEITTKGREWGNFDIQIPEQNKDLPD